MPYYNPRIQCQNEHFFNTVSTAFFHQVNEGEWQHMTVHLQSRLAYDTFVVGREKHKNYEKAHFQEL